MGSLTPAVAAAMDGRSIDAGNLMRELAGAGEGVSIGEGKSEEIERDFEGERSEF